MAETVLPPLARYAADARLRIDAALRTATDLEADCPRALREAMQYAVLAPGKRLRPLLVLMSAEACGGCEDQAMPAACAVEMVHAYSLVHDDLPAMDDDDLRRGRPTCHKVHGEALAILAGDALLTLAFEILARGVRPAARAAACCAELATAAGPSGMVGGQADDVVGGQADDVAGGLSRGGLGALESVHRRKTGALILASLRMGAIAADAGQAERDALDRYGRNLGLAFQITDDLLDVEGDESAAGKRLRKDSQQGKLTFPALLGVEESRRRAESLVRGAIDALHPLATAASRLEALAHYVLERNH